MKNEFVSASLTAGQLNAIVKKLGGHEFALKFLRGELVIEPFRNWREQDGIIYFSLTSDGTTGEQWILRLERKGYNLSDYAKSVLMSSDFKPTSGLNYEVAVLKGMLWNDSERITKDIRTYAAGQEFLTPNAELACLIREKFSDKELKAMGLYWVAVMHKPIEDSIGNSRLLGVNCIAEGFWLSASYSRPDGIWNRNNGFAFVLPHKKIFK